MLDHRGSALDATMRYSRKDGRQRDRYTLSAQAIQTSVQLTKQAVIEAERDMSVTLLQSTELTCL